MILSEHEKIFLATLNDNQTFQGIVAKVKAARPELPHFTVDSVTGKDNAPEWRQNSLIGDGFNLCLALLGVFND